MADLTYSQIYSKTSNEINTIQADNLANDKFDDISSINFSYWLFIQRQAP